MTVYGTGKYQFKVVENFFKRPRGWPFVEVADVAVDSLDNVYVFNRGPSPIVILERDGSFVGGWGQGMFNRPHGIVIDGDDNLLLTDDAIIHTKPELEIYADDVKCTHGATVGQLDREALFYLRSRGLAYDEARRMLVDSFAAEIVRRITDESLRDELAETVIARLPEMLAETA